MVNKSVLLPVVLLVAALLFCGALVSMLVKPAPLPAVIEAVSGLALVAVILFARK